MIECQETIHAPSVMQLHFVKIQNKTANAVGNTPNIDSKTIQTIPLSLVLKVCAQNVLLLRKKH